MNANKTRIDKWDKELILYCKSRSTTEAGLREIFARRVAMEIEHVQWPDIFHHFLELTEAFNLCSLVYLVDNLSPSKMWQYSDVVSNYTNAGRVFNVLISVIRNTEVAKFPGWNDEPLYKSQPDKIGHWWTRTVAKDKTHDWCVVRIFMALSGEFLFEADCDGNCMEVAKGCSGSDWHTEWSGPIAEPLE